MVQTARTIPTTFFAVCARLIGPEVKLIMEESLPGNLSAQDWAIIREIVDDVKTAIPDAAYRPAGEVLEYVRSRCIHSVENDLFYAQSRCRDQAIGALVGHLPISPSQQLAGEASTTSIVTYHCTSVYVHSGVAASPSARRGRPSRKGKPRRSVVVLNTRAPGAPVQWPSPCYCPHCPGRDRNPRPLSTA